MCTRVRQVWVWALDWPVTDSVTLGKLSKSLGHCFFITKMDITVYLPPKRYSERVDVTHFAKHLTQSKYVILPGTDKS